VINYCQRDRMGKNTILCSNLGVKKRNASFCSNNSPISFILLGQVLFMRKKMNISMKEQSITIRETGWAKTHF
jgi:hypothetical protein